MALDPQRLAEQITLFDYQLIAHIHPIEFIQYFFSEVHPVGEHKLCPSLQQAISRFDEESYWVMSEIMACAKHKEQVH